MPHGGARRGGGRPKGARDKKPRFATSGRTRQRTEDFVDRLIKAEALELPLERLLRRINDPTLSEEYKDKLASVAVAAFSCSIGEKTCTNVRCGDRNIAWFDE